LKIEVIAEIAQGYEGDQKLTDLLTTGALTSGADAVKYQLVYADELATPDYLHYSLFRSLEMPIGIWKEISKRVHDAERKLYFDVFGFDSLVVAHEIGADGVKLSTTEFYNRPLIEKALGLFEKVFISIGGIPVGDIDELMNDVLNDYSERICLMYGFQSEPTPLDQNNLSKLRTFGLRYPNFKLGFMDHSDGGSEEAFHLSLIAMGMGVSAIEKHLTLDRLLKIEDYVSGLAPEQFHRFVRLIQRYEPALGTGELDLSDLENEYRNKAAKSAVALRDLKKGQKIQIADIGLKRTGHVATGVPVRLLGDLLGHTLKTDVKKDHPLSTGDV